MRWIGVAMLVAGCGRLSFDGVAGVAGDGATSPDANPICEGGAQSNYPVVITADSPYAYYRLDDALDTAIDQSGNGHSATYASDNGGVITKGVAGALICDSDHGVTLFGDGNEMNGGQAQVVTASGDPVWGGDFTIELFERLNELPSTFPYGLLICETYLTDGFRTGVSTDNHLQFWNSEAGGSFHLKVPQVATVGEWTHFVVTKAGTTVTLYVNGIFATTGTVPDYLPPTNGTAECGIGAFHGLPARLDLDEVAIYARALDATTIAMHYAASGR